MKILFISVIFFSLIFNSGCGEQKQENEILVKKEVKQKTITKSTDLRASSSESIKIKIPTAVCETCENNIQTALTAHDGVLEVKIDLIKKTVKVVFDPAITGPDKLRQVISSAGYDADNVKRNLNAYQKLDECCKIELNIHS